MDPASGLRRPTMDSMVVVLPAPFGPTMPKISPLSTLKETSSTAVVCAVQFAQIFYFNNVCHGSSVRILHAVVRDSVAPE